VSRLPRIAAVAASAALGIGAGVVVGVLMDDGDHSPNPLGLNVSMVDQACTGEYLLVTAVGGTGSALGPGISPDPDQAHYLAIDRSCPTAWSPRGTVTDGYAAYLGPFDNRSEACTERVKRRGAFVTHLHEGNEAAVQCLCVLDVTTLPEVKPGQVVAPEDGVYVRYLEDLLTSMHLLRLDHHFDGHIDPLMVHAIKQVQADTTLPPDGVVGKLTWQSLIRQGCQELSD
jgi:peptidoglycan hydrolase-like protein with peptidoglycan-binding domain